MLDRERSERPRWLDVPDERWLVGSAALERVAEKYGLTLTPGSNGEFTSVEGPSTEAETRIVNLFIDLYVDKTMAEFVEHLKKRGLALDDQP